ncbi:hypothetical protein ACS0TY_015541 [Phlomoides rotata]
MSITLREKFQSRLKLPRGWEVDKKELEFIRGAHKLHSVLRVDGENVGTKTEDMCLDRYKVFLKQYNEWVEEESYKEEEKGKGLITKLFPR